MQVFLPSAKLDSASDQTKYWINYLIKFYSPKDNVIGLRMKDTKVILNLQWLK